MLDSRESIELRRRPVSMATVRPAVQLERKRERERAGPVFA